MWNCYNNLKENEGGYGLLHPCCDIISKRLSFKYVFRVILMYRLSIFREEHTFMGGSLKQLRHLDPLTL